MTAVRTPATRRAAASLGLPFARHLVLFAGSIALGAGLWLVARDQTAVWVVAGVVTGLVAGVLARGFAGPIVAALGLLIGVAIALQATTDGHWPLDELERAAPAIGLALAAVVVAYVAVRLILRRRPSPRRHRASQRARGAIPPRG